MPAPGAATPATDAAPETDDAPEAEVAEAEATETEATETEAATGPAEPEVAEAPLTAEQILELADQIADAAAPLEPLSEGNDAPPEVSVTGADSSAEGLTRIPASVPGISRSLRPQLRPEAPVAAAAAAEAASPAPQAGAPVEVTTAAIPVGTSLVQLGAFESAEIAASEWDRISGRFSDFMADKERVIQQAESGGRRSSACARWALPISAMPAASARRWRPRAPSASPSWSASPCPAPRSLARPGPVWGPTSAAFSARRTPGASSCLPAMSRRRTSCGG